MASNSKKRSFLFLMSVAFLVAYTGYSITNYLYESSKYYDGYVERKSINTVNYLKLSENLLRAGLTEDLSLRLEDAYQAKYIDFYILRKNGEVLYFANADNDVNKLNVQFEQYNSLLTFEDVSYGAIRFNDYEVAAGFNVRKSDYIAHLADEQGDVILRDLVIVVLAFIFIVFYFFQDIIRVLSVLRKRNRSDIQKIKTKSSESELLVSSISGFEKNLETLAYQKDLFQKQVLPGLKSEILSGKTPPYDFDCVLVRMDINNFTNIFTNYPIEPFMEVINNFFTDAAQIVGRYNGYVHEFVGDEIIFYFKTSEMNDSAAMAFSSVREIQKIAEKYNGKTSENPGYPFYVKASLSEGKLRFGPQVGGFTLAGGVLIESVRILSHIGEKKKNTVYFGEAIRNQITTIAESDFVDQVALKGINEEFKLYNATTTLNLGDVLNHLENKAHLIRYFRSDAGLESILQHLAKGITQLNYQTQIDLLLELREFRVERTAAPVLNNFTQLLKVCTEQSKTAESERDLYFLSGLISAGRNILDTRSCDQSLMDLLIGLLDHEEPRVVANTVELLSHFERDLVDNLVAASTSETLFEISKFLDLTGRDNNRVIANAIVRSGKEELSDKVVSELKKLMMSKDPLYISSGVYAVAALTDYYKKENIVYLQAHTKFLELVQFARSLAHHPDDVVRRQALRAREISEDIHLAQKAS